MSKNESIINKIPYRSRVKALNTIIDVAHRVLYGDSKERAHQRKLELQNLRVKRANAEAYKAQAKADEAQAKAVKAQADRDKMIMKHKRR